MKSDLLDLLACPECAGTLELQRPETRGNEIVSGDLTCAKCRRSYPIVGAIPRFVPSENYASTFGFQWNRFRKTQLDSHTGLPISKERFCYPLFWWRQSSERQTSSTNIAG